MKIVLKSENAKKINLELSTAQQRAKTRRISDWRELAKLTADTVNELGASKVHLGGCRIVYTVGAGYFPASYRGIPEGTQAIIELGKDGLGRLVKCERVNCNCGQEVQLYLTQECVQSIARNKYGAKII